MADNKVVDPWEAPVVDSDEKSWDERTSIQVLKTLTVIGLIYLFILSLNLMGNAFKILGGPTAGKTFRNNEIFDNPFAGLVLGILATVLVQSSSTSTSIIISMTAAELMEVKNAIPMIMGANIGTSVTNTIVSFAQIGNRNQYRRAFAGATVHDCFNWLTVLILLPIEAITASAGKGLLHSIGEGIVTSSGLETAEKGQKVDFLKVITKPITSRMVSVDKKLVTKVAKEDDPVELEKLLKKSMISNRQTKSVHLFMDTPMSDGVAGTLLLVISLALLSVTLILLVKTLQSVFRGRAAVWLKSILNMEFKSIPMLGDYVLILFGIGITILMQSSSVTTSALTPLVGVGLIKLEKMLCLTVGANVGTTITGILSALASSNIAIGMQVALAHLFFNIFGFLIWFPLPFMRAVPLSMAKVLGNLAADWKFFPIVYVIMAFGVLPCVLLGLSLAGAIVFGIFFSLIMLTFAGLCFVIYARLKKPTVLPASLSADPKWMPNSLRVEPIADDSAVVAPESADLSIGPWWQSSVAWGLGWIIVLIILMGLPNNQWSTVYYAKFAKIDHVGFGPWTACSASYKDDLKWASMPSCAADVLPLCAGDIVGCKSEEPESNGNYEKAWANCTKAGCSTEQWTSYCQGLTCAGSLHKTQCANVSKAVTPKAQITYDAQATWPKGEQCRSMGDICDNGSTLAHSGNLGAVGLTVFLVAQIALMFYHMRMSKPGMFTVLYAAFGSFILAWVLLLASWASYSTALGADATCVIEAPDGTGLVRAKGVFGDITERSYSHDFMIIGWALTNVVIAIVAHKIFVLGDTSAAPAV